MARICSQNKKVGALSNKPIGKRPIGRPSRIWVGNIRVDLEETSIGLFQIRIKIIGEQL